MPAGSDRGGFRRKRGTAQQRLGGLCQEIAFADPPPLIDPNPPVGIELGGDWSTYWYNGRIYESDITRGLVIWNINDARASTYYKETRSNPQTQTFTIDPGFGGGVSASN